MDASVSVSITTTLLVLILAGLLGYVYVENRRGTGAGQPTWTTPQYLRYNQPVYGG